VTGELPGKHFFQSLGIEANHHLAANNNGGSGAAVVRPRQFKNRLLVNTDILNIKSNASRREEGFRRITGRSTGLAENYDFFI
jgi:hypothetical protein